MPFVESVEAFNLLKYDSKQLHYPVVFLTNALYKHSWKAEQLSTWLHTKVYILLSKTVEYSNFKGSNSKGVRNFWAGFEWILRFPNLWRQHKFYLFFLKTASILGIEISDTVGKYANVFSYTGIHLNFNSELIQLYLLGYPVLCYR